MKLLNFSIRGGRESRLGLVHEGKILDVQQEFREVFSSEPPSWFHSTDSLIRGGEEALALLRRLALKTKGIHLLDPSEVVYYPAVLRPEKIFCMFLNYETHAKEASRGTPKDPFLFLKLPSNLIGHGWPILLPKSSREVDYEGELAVILGRTGKYIRSTEAYDYVFGYSIMNDVSFRDRRAHSLSKELGPNLIHAKNLDGSAPFGPWIVTRDEIPDPHGLSLKTWVNEELRQNDNTRNMIFKIPEILEYISNGITLRPGDVISTGTPSGVGLSTGKYLRKGDVVKVEIENVGPLINGTVEET